MMLLLGGVALALLVPGGIGWLLQRAMKTHPIVTAVIAVVLAILLLVLVVGVLVVRTLIGIGQAGTVSVDGEGVFAASLMTDGVLEFMLVLVLGIPAALFAAFWRRAQDAER